MKTRIATTAILSLALFFLSLLVTGCQVTTTQTSGTSTTTGTTATSSSAGTTTAADTTTGTTTSSSAAENATVSGLDGETITGTNETTGTSTGTGTDASAAEAKLNNWKGGRLSPAEFSALLGPIARITMQKTGVPASVILAQAALETGWGKSTIGDAKNLFGIKGTGPAGSLAVPTREYGSNGYYTTTAKFRKYHTWLESMEDHARLLSQSSRYRKAMAVKSDPKQFAREIHRAGYATDPKYANLLIQIMDSNNLYKWNQ